MPSAAQILPPPSLSGSLKSYGRALRGWTGGIALRYILAVVFMLAAAACVIAAVGVGLAALFHWIDAYYGTTYAYGGIAGLLVLLALISALVGIVLLKRPLPPLPSPRRQMKTASRAITANAMLAVSRPHRALIKADPATEIMIGLAAACLAGWLVSSRLRGRAK